MKKTPPIIWIGIAGCLLLILSGDKGCSFVTTKPPIAVPVDLPVAVAVAIDQKPGAVEQLTKDYPGVIGYVQDWAKSKKGDFRLIDTNNANPPTMDADWVQAAWKAIDRTKPPTIIAATPTSGVPSQPLPKSKDEAAKLLAPLVK